MRQFAPYLLWSRPKKINRARRSDPGTRGPDGNNQWCSSCSAKKINGEKGKEDTRKHLEHGRPDYMFWSLASMVNTKKAIWESRTPPDYSSKSPITKIVVGLFALYPGNLNFGL